MEGHARISNDVIARYAADAAREVAGVTGLVESQLHRHHGVRLSGEGEALTVEVHLEVEWGAALQSLGQEVQRLVAETLGRMLDVHPASVDVVVAAVR